MPDCPICQTEYFEGQGNCRECKWDLSLVSIGEQTPEEVLEKATAWARNIWQEYAKLKPQPETPSQLNSFKEQLRQITERVYLLEQFEGEYQQSNSKIQESIAEQKQLKSQLEEIASEHDNNSQFFTRIEGEINQIKTDKSQLKSQLSRLETNFQQQLQSQISESNIQLQQQLTSLKKDSEQQLQSQLSQIKSDTDDRIHPLQTRLEEIEHSHQEIKAFLDHNARLNSTASITASPSTDNRLAVEEPNTSQNESEMPTQLSTTWEEHQLVKQYNNDLSNLLEGIKEVSETQKSMSDRSAGASQTVTLEEKPRGMYGIVNQGNYHYLVPSKSFRITDSNYKTLEALFECRGYQRGHSERFELLKPATVIPLSDNQNWQLQKRGILEFELD